MAGGRRSSRPARTASTRSATSIPTSEARTRSSITPSSWPTWSTKASSRRCRANERSLTTTRATCRGTTTSARRRGSWCRRSARPSKCRATASGPSAVARAARACGWRKNADGRSTRSECERRSRPERRHSRWHARSARSCSTTGYARQARSFRSSTWRRCWRKPSSAAAGWLPSGRHNSGMPEGGLEYVDLPIYHEKLSQALNFTAADLQENRAGRLSGSQRSAQLRVVARSAAKSVVLLLLAGGCVAAWVAIGVTTVLGLIPLVLAALFLAWIGTFAWYIPPIWRVGNARVVFSVECFVKPAERERDVSVGSGQSIPMWTYYWVVDDRERFWIPGKVYPVLVPARHRLYFLPASRRIVAAEPIS